MKKTESVRLAPPIYVCRIDPGPKPGVVVVSCFLGEVKSYAYFDVPAEDIVGWIKTQDKIAYWAVERYQIRPVRNSSQSAQTLTLTQAEACRAAAQDLPQTRVVQFLPPGSVKPWATDDRLKEFGVRLNNRHHRDAARHALYLASKMHFVKWGA